MTAPTYSDEQLTLVVDAIKDHPNYEFRIGLTIEEIAKAMGVSYQGARNYINSATAARKIERIMKPGRQQYYRLPDTSRIPKFTFKIGAAPIPFDMAAKVMANGNYTSLDEVKMLPMVVGMMYDIAARVATGTKIPVSELKELKLLLQRVQLIGQNLNKVCGEIVDEPRMWDAHALSDMLLMDPMNPVTVDEARAVANAIQERYTK